MEDEQLGELRSRLDDIAEEIADIGRAKLRRALDADDAQAVNDERRLSRARRSVLKAAALLGGGEPGDDDT
jgi:DNA-binding ferritin-like protein